MSQKALLCPICCVRLYVAIVNNLQTVTSCHAIHSLTQLISINAVIMTGVVTIDCLKSVLNWNLTKYFHLYYLFSQWIRLRVSKENSSEFTDLYIKLCKGSATETECRTTAFCEISVKPVWIALPKALGMVEKPFTNYEKWPFFSL